MSYGTVLEHGINRRTRIQVAVLTTATQGSGAEERACVSPITWPACRHTKQFTTTSRNFPSANIGGCLALLTGCMRADREDREDGVTRAAHLSVSAVQYTGHRAHREGKTWDAWTGTPDIPGHGLHRKSGIKCVLSVTGAHHSQASLKMSSDFVS